MSERSEYYAAMQRIVGESMDRALREMWRQTPWRKKMRMRWNRLKRVWGPW